MEKYRKSFPYCGKAGGAASSLGVFGVNFDEVVDEPEGGFGDFFENVLEETQAQFVHEFAEPAGFADDLAEGAHELDEAFADGDFDAGLDEEVGAQDGEGEEGEDDHLGLFAAVVADDDDGVGFGAGEEVHEAGFVLAGGLGGAKGRAGILAERVILCWLSLGMAVKMAQ